MTSDGAKFGYAFVYCQISMSVLSLICFIPWLVSKDPIGPAVRLANEKTYLTVMLTSQSSGDITEGINGNTVFDINARKLVRFGLSLTSPYELAKA
jgi:hypothetical protein